MKKTILYGMVMQNGVIDGLATYRRNRAMRASAARLKAIQAKVVAQIEQQRSLEK